MIGGLGSITGAILGALWVIGLPAFFPDNELVPQFTSSVGLLIMLMYFPGGFIQIANSARNGIVSFAERRMGLEAAPASSTAAPASISRRRSDEPLPDITLKVTDGKVTFGGVLLQIGALHGMRLQRRKGHRQMPKAHGVHQRGG